MSVSADEKRLDLAKKIKSNIGYQDIPLEDLIDILAEGSFRTFSAGDNIFMEGDEINYLYYVYSGKVEIYGHTSGFSKRIFYTLRDGDNLNLSQMAHLLNFPQSKFKLTANCLCDCEIVSIPKDVFFSDIISHPVFSKNIIRSLAYIVNEAYDELTKDTVDEKIAVYLNYLTKYTSFTDDGRTYIPRKFSDERMAEIVGTTRETVNRVLKRFCDQKIIFKQKKKFEIIDKQALSEIAGGVETLIGFYDTVGEDLKKS